MVSLVIPAYNESAIIKDAVLAAAETLSSLGDEWELIVADDGSTDKTADIVRGLGVEKVNIIQYSPNRGKGFAVRSGMLAAKGDYVFFTDADLAYGLGVIKRALEVFEKTGADAVIGSRRLDREAYGNYPLSRRVTSSGFAFFSRLLSGMKYDTQCGFKGFKRAAARAVFSECEEERFAFDFEVMLLFDRLGFKTAEMPVRIINHRASKVNIVRDSLRMARDVLKIKRRVGAKGRCAGK